MAVKSEALIVDEVTKEGRIFRLEERRTPELVIALVGPIASGVTESSTLFMEILKRDYGYRPFYYKVSTIIKESSKFVDKEYTNEISPAKRIKILQEIGNKLRERFGDNYLAKKCIDQIANNRLDNNGYLKEDDTLIPVPKRFVHVIDALKHPSELDFLRMVYGDLLTLVGVFAPLDLRRDRLKNEGVPEAELDQIITTDRDEEGNIHGQKVTKTFYNSDLFIRNDKSNDKELKRSISRYLEIVFSTEIHSPTKDEMAMYNAMSVGSNSACMSRQVGAAIYSNSGELIGVGWNGDYILDKSGPDAHLVIKRLAEFPMCDMTNPIFHDEDKAREHLEALQWPDGRYCPHCGESERTSPVKGTSHRPGLYYCLSCKKTFTVTVGTLFERSKVPLHKWVLAFHLMAASKKGISAHQLHRMLGVTYKTAWFMAHRIREALRPDSESGPFGRQQ